METAVVILPGGGFVKIVPDKEGSEAAEWFNRRGITASRPCRQLAD